MSLFPRSYHSLQDTLSEVKWLDQWLEQLSAHCHV